MAPIRRILPKPAPPQRIWHNFQHSQLCDSKRIPPFRVNRRIGIKSQPVTTDKAFTDYSDYELCDAIGKPKSDKTRSENNL